MIKQVGVLYSSLVPEARPLANDVCEWLSGQNQNACSISTDDLDELRRVINGFSLLIVLGGDGTTLLAGRMAAPFGVPIFGINLGRVGFLSEASPGKWQDKLLKVINGRHWLEHRLMLKADIIRDGQLQSELIGLNEIVVSRGAQARVVRFHLYVDGDHVIEYMADGLIAATPTGSTAYSMAAGGPLLPPQLQNFLVLPVAPHLSFERPLVLHQDAVINIQVETVHDAIATSDGQDPISLRSGDEVMIARHSCDSIFARVDGPSYFYLRLMQRLSYWSRKQ